MLFGEERQLSTARVVGEQKPTQKNKNITTQIGCFVRAVKSNCCTDKRRHITGQQTAHHCNYSVSRRSPNNRCLIHYLLHKLFIRDHTNSVSRLQNKSTMCVRCPPNDVSKSDELEQVLYAGRLTFTAQVFTAKVLVIAFPEIAPRRRIDVVGSEGAVVVATPACRRPLRGVREGLFVIVGP